MIVVDYKHICFDLCDLTVCQLFWNARLHKLEVLLSDLAELCFLHPNYKN